MRSILALTLLFSVSAQAGTLFKTVSTCTSQKGGEVIKVMVNDEYGRAFGTSGVPVVLADAKDVVNDELDIAGKKNVIMLKGVRRYDLLIAEGEFPFLFGKKLKVQLTATTDNSFTSEDSPINSVVNHSGAGVEVITMRCKDTRK